MFDVVNSIRTTPVTQVKVTYRDLCRISKDYGIKSHPLPKDLSKKRKEKTKVEAP